MAYIRPDLAQIGTIVQVQIGDERQPAEVVKMPFYRRPEKRCVFENENTPYRAGFSILDFGLKRGNIEQGTSNTEYRSEAGRGVDFSES